jgi:SMC interacting uncharacterized protein involved in chromosome segregation
MRSKPRVNNLDIFEPVASTRKDLEQIQECLKNNLSKRRSSQECLSSLIGKSDQVEPTASRMQKEVEQLGSPIVSDYLAAEIDLSRAHQVQQNTDCSLIINEEKSNNVQNSHNDSLEKRKMCKS